MARRKRVRHAPGAFCEKCERDESLHVHHIVALVDGGADDPSNLSTLCAGCHAEWHALEMVSRIPFRVWRQMPTLGWFIMYEIVRQAASGYVMPVAAEYVPATVRAAEEGR
jgi:hypothetical protein